MTIKPLINQKSKDEGNKEEQTQNNSPQREKRSHSSGHVYGEENVGRHRRTPQKGCGLRKREKRERGEREKPLGSSSPHNNNISSATTSHERTGAATSGNVRELLEESFSGYNSGDEHIGQRDAVLTPEEWTERDEKFVKAMSERGLIVKEIAEDGACLFRAISLQIYGDQDMHEVIRKQALDYIYQNREYFAQFVTEDISSYVQRKRQNHVHGNHIEIQAMSEIYNRPVELYCYQTKPINIFNPGQCDNGYEPLRLSYQRCSHYNAILDPFKASVGVGLGLAGYKPEDLDVKQVRDAVRLSEDLEIEQTMFEDKLKTTDWEATNEAIEEQIARESYLQWCREQRAQKSSGSSSTVTSTAVSGNNMGAGSSTMDLRAEVCSTSTENATSRPSDTETGSGGNSPSCERQRRRRRRLEEETATSEGSDSKKAKRRPQSGSNSPVGTPASTPGPSSREESPDEKPLSLFYRSLLESSYADDGDIQMSETEMIQKALHMSRVDFIKVRQKHSDYDSP
ncbi:OTU domain-containing protein 5 [Lutzomyia longipalpis]|uniref:OTU domain-containing protein 5 n=1 Tax=Lutzomyia longipalpis TaxID=7200 RepID=UPI00248351CD|nr:OTU domain-containing protein 5 [Lutzomyia longipalpis]XP_055688067.1 OTU domain-containing protein 5 [Lutzomyia longipalpis]